MENKKIVPLDVPEPISSIKKFAEDYNAAKELHKFVTPPGEWWNGNQTVTFYHGYFSGLQKALNGMDQMIQNGLDPKGLYHELSVMMGQVANFVVEKAPKIITLDK